MRTIPAKTTLVLNLPPQAKPAAVPATTSQPNLRATRGNAADNDPQTTRAKTTRSAAVSRRIPWPAHSRQRFLHCLVCGCEELCSAGLCRRCYDAAYHSETYFGGLKEAVLARDGHGCRGCGDPTGIVHHRKPGVNELDWLIALCARCHAVVHRLERLDRYLPPFLLALWREQHPEAVIAQLQFPLES